MFSKNRTNESSAASEKPATPSASSEPSFKKEADFASGTPAPKPPASTLSADLNIVGNIKTTGDIQVEGTVEGDIRAHLLTIGEGATVKGEVMADDVVINGRIVGRVRGLKVRLTATARVEGDIIHKTIAIESGAHFEGSVQRKDDPLTKSGGGSAASAGATSGTSTSTPPRSVAARANGAAAVVAAAAAAEAAAK